MFRKIRWQSEIIKCAMLCKRTISCTKTEDKVANVKWCSKAKLKRAYFLNLSTITDKVVTPYDLGMPLIKSGEISSQILVRMVRGCNKPTGERDEDFYCWQN